MIPRVSDQSYQGKGRPELCTKMLRDLDEKIRAKFPATTRGYSTPKIARLDDTFWEVFEREASPVESQSPQKKDKKRTKQKGRKNLKKERKA